MKTTTIYNLAYNWGLTFVGGGCDNAYIDMGNEAVREDFLTFAKQVLKKDEFNRLSAQLEEYFSCIEKAVAEALVKNGYKQKNTYFFELIS